MPLPSGCPNGRPPYSEVTEVNCRVPSALFTQAPWYSLPVHLCRFRVRSMRGLFPGTPSPHAESNDRTRLSEFVTTRWPRNIHLVPIDYAFRPRLRDRLTLRRLPLRRNPWTFGDSVFHTVFVTHVSIRASDTSRGPHRSSFAGLRNAPLPLVLRRTQSFGAWFKPRYIFGAGTLI